MADSKPLDSIAEDFVDPAPEYGPVPLWWWDGDELDLERMTDQLEMLADNGVPAVCFISKLPNGPEGNTPHYFTERWWDAMEHAVEECDRLGMELWVHDETYHHSPPTWREFWQDHIRTEAGSNPDLRGEVLHREYTDVTDGEAVTLRGPRTFEPLRAAAYPRAADGTLDLDGAVELDVQDEAIEWDGRDGEWHVTAIGTRAADLRYTDKQAVERYIDLHFEEYVRRLGEAVGETLVGTFEDELVVLNGEVPCDETVLERFREEKGYDPIENLVALYEDTNETTAIRTDYYDVVVSLLEENWFEPLYEWHEEHGLARAHDNWGRNNLAAGTEQYGDYYRTMRWYQVPGYDDGGPQAIGQRNFFDAKLAASIAACYDRDRVWGELFHSTTWGFRPRSQLAGIVENFCYGCTLYDKHGYYYTTQGGWWAHAPPDTHFRQPYWEDIGELNAATHRLSQVMSQGTPVVDAAIAFPVATMHADWHPEDGVGSEARERDQATRELTETLYDAGTDLVLADNDSLTDAAVDGHLEISGMEIPALVIPPSTAISAETLATARELYESGGVVVVVGGPPETVVGGDDSDVTLFGDSWDGTQTIRRNDVGGELAILPKDGDVAGVLSANVAPDLRRDESGIYHAHRRVADGDVYLLFNPRDESRTIGVGFRSDGVPERWDPLTGEREPIREFDREDGYTTTTFEFAPHGFALVVLRDEDTRNSRILERSAGFKVTDVTASTVSGYATTKGEVHATVTRDDGDVIAAGEGDSPIVRDLSEGWEFDLEETLDNKWGDFRYPASEGTIGPEVREFAYRLEQPGEDGRKLGWTEPGIDDGAWEVVRWSYGPGFWRKTVDANNPGVTPNEAGAEGWERYEFSELVGKPGTHPYLMGYMSTVSDNYLVTPDGEAGERTYFWTTISTNEPGIYLCYYGQGIESVTIGAQEVAAAPTNRGVDDTDDDHDPEEDYDWLNVPGEDEPTESASVRLPDGQTPVLLGVEPGTETYFAVEPEPATAFDRDLQFVPRVRWFHDDGQGPAWFDPFPWESEPVGWYRFEVPAGTSAMDLPLRGSTDVWVDGTHVESTGDRVEFDRLIESPTLVAVRVEHDDGAYGGAAWTGPAALETRPVTVNAGDWRDLGLDSYSGRATYRKTVEFPDVAEHRVRLDFGDIAASATVLIDGERVGSTFTPPFTVDLTEHVTEGEHVVEVEVANTLANHFATETPNEYRELLLSSFRRGGADLLPEYDAENQFAGGLLGPVKLRIEPAVTLSLE